MYEERRGPGIFPHVRDFKGRSEGALGLRTAKRAKIPSKDLARGGTGAQNSKKIPSKDLARGIYTKC